MMRLNVFCSTLPVSDWLALQEYTPLSHGLKNLLLAICRDTVPLEKCPSRISRLLFPTLVPLAKNQSSWTPGKLDPHNRWRFLWKLKAMPLSNPSPFRPKKLMISLWPENDQDGKRVNCATTFAQDLQHNLNTTLNQTYSLARRPRAMHVTL